MDIFYYIYKYHIYIYTYIYCKLNLRGVDAEPVMNSGAGHLRRGSSQRGGFERSALPQPK
jgi:hypothetical protein